ncbi:hypothetical protein F5B21DRAFT_149025 [Xylaria acuta]|nr:hypothetical protein F5B21DRAFT_149025 [Xylaria acuta]
MLLAMLLLGPSMMLLTDAACPRLSPAHVAYCLSNSMKRRQRQDRDKNQRRTLKVLVSVGTQSTFRAEAGATRQAETEAETGAETEAETEPEVYESGRDWKGRCGKGNRGGSFRGGGGGRRRRGFGRERGRGRGRGRRRGRGRGLDPSRCRLVPPCAERREIGQGETVEGGLSVACVVPGCEDLGQIGPISAVP